MDGAGDVLKEEIAVYENMRAELERDHFGKWSVIHGYELIGIYETLQDAAIDASDKYGRGPYLIRQVGASTERLPSAAMYGRDYAYG